jgi:ABC-type ATPase involved in cell division
MARYTCSYIVKTSVDKIYELLKTVIQDCNCEVIYTSNEYVMGRESPGKVPFSKLVTIEVLIDSTNALADKTKIDLVVKNEELPLQVENHCRQVFNLLQKNVAQDQQWQLIENAIN